MSINRWVGSGNLTRDAEYKQTSGGSEVLDFSIACNERRKNNKTGDWDDYPNYVDCSLFGKRANALHRQLLKGTKVVVEGRLRYSSWTDKQTGQKRTKLSVIVDDIEFMAQRKESQNKKDKWTDEDSYGYYEDDDLPF